MKRKLIASILGIAACSAMVATSYGQGQITFANYASGETAVGAVPSPSAPITFGAGSGALVGTALGSDVGSGFSAELLYQYAGMTGGSAGPVAGYDLAQDGGGNTAIAPFYPKSAGGLFEFNGPNGSLVSIPGSTQTQASVSFIVYVFGTVNATSYVGQSAVFTQNLANPASDLFNNGILTPGAVLTTFTASPVPEPSTIALLGLGAASLVAIRRRK
jgi:hypothetical protein